MSEEATGEVINEATGAVRQPVIEDVYNKTQQLIQETDLFTARRAKAVVELIAGAPDKLKTADLLAVLAADEDGLPQ